MNVNYEIIPEYQKRWFREGRVVYKLIKNFQHWDDPSYGNGGGDYRDAKQLVHTFDLEQDAIDAKNALSKVSP